MIEQLTQLKARQVELLATMKRSDDVASKCTKMGLSFKKTYPDEFQVYSAANTEYNENEVTIARLEKEIETAEANEKLDGHGMEHDNPDNN